MATYIVLNNFTDQGIRGVRETTNRADAIREMGSKFGVNMKDVYWTLGSVDVVTIVEASDEASATAFALAIGAAGNVRTQVLRAFTQEEMKPILGKLVQAKVAAPA
jgi:uncharacterized protein with GYD domain